MVDTKCHEKNTFAPLFVSQTHEAVLEEEMVLDAAPQTKDPTHQPVSLLDQKVTTCAPFMASFNIDHHMMQNRHQTGKWKVEYAESPVDDTIKSASRPIITASKEAPVLKEPPLLTEIPPAPEADELTPEERTFLENELHGLDLIFEAEQAKGHEADQEKLFWLALARVLVFMRLMSRDDEEYVLNKLEEMLAHVHKVQDTHNPMTSVILNVLSVLLHVAGGVCSGLKVAGSSVFLSVKTAKDVAGMAVPLSGIGSATSGLCKIPDESAASVRALAEHYLQEARQRRETRVQSKEQERGSQQSTSRSIDELIAQLHRAIEHILSKSQ